MINRQKLRKAIINKLIYFGNGMTEFHTQHIEELLNWIKDLEASKAEEVIEHETHESHE